MSLNDVLAVGFITILGVALFAFIVRPLREGLPVEETVERIVNTLTGLYFYRDTLEQALRDLTLDRQIGKISDEDYRRFQEQLAQEATATRHHIEALQAQEGDVREVLEGHVRALREGVTIASVGFPEPNEESAPRFCTQCGKPLHPTDRFCSQCGAAVPALWYDPVHRAG